MKRPSSQLGIWLSAAAILIAGCNKKPQPMIAPQAEAPTVSTPETTTPPAATPPATNEPAATTSIPVNEPPAQPAPTATKPATKPRARNNHARKTAPSQTSGKEANGTGSAASGQATTTTAANIPGKTTVVRDGGNSNPPGDILPGMNHNEAAQQRQTIDQLLQSTDAALKAITRSLSSEERATVEQIRTYMAQSRSAETDGDLLRANNLATKAHLLSDSLAKH